MWNCVTNVRLCLRLCHCDLRSEFGPGDCDSYAHPTPSSPSSSPLSRLPQSRAPRGHVHLGRATSQCLERYGISSPWLAVISRHNQVFGNFLFQGQPGKVVLQDLESHSKDSFCILRFLFRLLHNSTGFSLTWRWATNILCNFMALGLWNFISGLVWECIKVLWCSGYHICFTRRRSPVRSRAGSWCCLCY